MALAIVKKELLSIGRNAQVDPGATIGECPARSIADLRLIVGEGLVIRSGSVIYAGSTIGDCLQLGHNVIIREENQIGKDVCIWSNTIIDYGCQIGNRVKIHSSVYVSQFTVLEDDVFLAPGVMIANDPHPGCPRARECMRGATIRRGARIGINVTLVPFITIGEEALIGAGAVVTRDIPARAVAYGNPARVVGTVDELRCLLNPPLVKQPYAAGFSDDSF